MVEQPPATRLHQWQSPYTSNHPTLYFNDGKRRIDYVLVFQPEDKLENDEIRNSFLTGLGENGLEYEVEDCFGKVLIESTSKYDDKSKELAATHAGLQSISQVTENKMNTAPPTTMERLRQKAKGDKIEISKSDVAFVKLYAPWSTAARYAELLTLRKSLKRFVKPEEEEEGYGDDPPGCSLCLELDREELKPLYSGYNWPFQVRREYLFDIPENRDTFFTSVDRALICDYILKRTPFTSIKDSEPKAGDIGITKLLSDDVYKAAYPLHEPGATLQSMYAKESKERNHEQMTPEYFSEPSRLNNRTLLQRQWASYKKLAKMQPLNYIRYYFGESLAFYFAWLGFYTAWLGPVAIIGVVVFLLGILNIYFDPLTSEVCHADKDLLMCPLCSNERCKFWTLNTSCFRFKLTRLIDNEGTVCFGILMALWAILFLEMWKRREMSLAFRWNVFSLEPLDQPARPEFLALLENKRIEGRKNKISGMVEPYIPFWTRKIPFIFVSYSVVLLGIVLTLSSVVGVILYKLIIKAILYKNPNPFLQSTAGMLTTITGSVINLVLIMLLKLIFNKLAEKMNDWECHRTQQEYDDNLILKLYLLQFVNYYSTVFYIAFIQGTTSALPGSKHSPAQSTGCDQGDCLFELFLQLIIIMVGKQFFSFMQETLVPIFMRLFMRIVKRMPSLGNGDEESATSLDTSESADLIACRADYTLLDPGSRPLFNEYLEMMIQFGFITMFVPAFPLAPFFGLLNNIAEIRGDAKKFLSQYRRPVLQRVRTIGIWFSILSVLASIAIRTNACIIAFTTRFIDRWVYRFSYSPDMSLVGFVNFTLSYMPTDRFNANTTEKYCRYMDYRNDPWQDPDLSPTIVHYHVLAAKFIFVFLFETLAVVLTSFIATAVPDVPEHISTQIFCETSITNDIIAHAERPGEDSKGSMNRKDLNLDALRDISKTMSSQLSSLKMS